MTNDWHPFSEQDPDGQPADHADDTQPLSRPVPPAATATTVAEPPKRTRSLSAAVLVGALVLGGAAGVGGAAAYDGIKGDSSTSSNGGDITASPSSNQGTNTSNSSSSSAVENVAQKVLPSVVQINVTGSSESGTGSGIVLTKDGTILTNNHVVAVAGKSGSIVVNFQDGSSAKASIVGTDPVTDLAVIKAQGVNDLTPASIGKSSDLKVGQQVVAIGSPFGLGATVTSGIVSALDRAVSVSTSEEGQGGSGGSGGSGGGIDPFGGQDPFGLQQQQQQQGSSSQSTTYPAIQTDAAINPGNSGGPLVNLDGQVVGINSSIRTSGSSSDSGSIGLGFAIPMDEALPIINQLRNNETPTHARLGVTVSDNGSGSNATQTGALVKSVEQGGSAAQAGLKQGDVITKVGDKLIDGADDLVATIRGDRPDQTVTLTVLRGGKTQTVDAKLGSDAGNQNS